jgi:Protein of unknown function (DUF3099)
VPGRRPYLILMGTCLLLIVMAWTWVRLLSDVAAIVMSAVALAIPPFAAIVANAGRETEELRRDDRTGRD